MLCVTLNESECIRRQGNVFTTLNDPKLRCVIVFSFLFLPATSNCCHLVHMTLHERGAAVTLEESSLHTWLKIVYTCTLHVREQRTRQALRKPSEQCALVNAIPPLCTFFFRISFIRSHTKYIYIIVLCLRMCVDAVAMAYVWRPQDNLSDPLLGGFLGSNSDRQSRVAKHFDLLSRLTSPKTVLDSQVGWGRTAMISRPL